VPLKIIFPLGNRKVPSYTLLLLNVHKEINEKLTERKQKKIFVSDSFNWLN
jgi:hypothetical protein